MGGPMAAMNMNQTASMNLNSMVDTQQRPRQICLEFSSHAIQPQHQMTSLPLGGARLQRQQTDPQQHGQPHGQPHSQHQIQGQGQSQMQQHAQQQQMQSQQGM